MGIGMARASIPLRVYISQAGDSLVSVMRRLLLIRALLYVTGQLCVLDVDTQGMEQLRKAMFPTKVWNINLFRCLIMRLIYITTLFYCIYAYFVHLQSLFLIPPSLEVLEVRLRHRGTETEEQLRIRISNAAAQMEYGRKEGNFDVIIKNDDLDATVDEVLKYLRLWFPLILK
jgi:hypothetical protein